MRIRTQNLIAIVPLFLVMAGAAGAMTYSTAREEMMWGLREEVTALSVAMTEFISGSDLEPGDAALVDRLNSLEQSFYRVIEHGQVKFVYALDRDGEVVWRYGGAVDAAFVPEGVAPGLAAADLAALTRGAASVSTPVTTLASGEDAMLAYSPIRDAAGNVAGSLGVVIDASRVATLSSDLLLHLARLTLLALVIGTLASLFISSLLTAKVRALSRAALQVAGGQYDRQIQIGTIQELSDLSNTFNTMSSVLKDLIERTRRTLIEGEQFRTPLDLARTYRQDTWSDLSRVYGGVYVASRSIGGGHPGDVYGVVEREGTVTVFVGRVTEGRELDSAIAAAAARRAIEEGTLRWPVPQVLNEVCRLLRIKLETASWRPDSDADAMLASYDGSGSPRKASLHLDHEQTALLHTFPGKAGDVLHRWKRVFERMSPEALVENLGRTLESGAMGTLVGVGRESVGAETLEVF